MSFGLKSSFGRICKVEAFKQLYTTGMRPRTFSELIAQLISEKEENAQWKLTELPGIWEHNYCGFQVKTKN